jgi:hypothetical protein
MTSEFKESFAHLGLEQYLPSLLQTGFYDWHSLCRITERDFATLGVKLGHRRKLQREMARRHLWPDSEPLPVGRRICRAIPSQGQTALHSKL